MDHETAQRIAFEAYVVGLPQAREAAQDRDALDAYLGDVDAQAGSMSMADRMTLAGRVLAASVVLAGGTPPDVGDVEALIDARLSYGRAQRERAAPLGDGRLWPEDEAAPGLGDLITEADDDELAEECATVASYVLQFGLRPSMDVDAALIVGEELRLIAHEAQALLDVSGAVGLAGAEPGALLARAAAAARGAGQVLVVIDEHGDGLPAYVTARDSWIHLAASLVAARARWAGVGVDWDAAIVRATERVASSLVYEDRTRFAASACAEHAVGVVIDAATVWLDEVLEGEESEDRPFLWEGLLEAASSGLVGAWVESGS